MTTDEARSWLAESVVEFAHDLANAKDLDEAEALTKAKEMLQKMLPAHEATEGHSFNWIRDGANRVGRIWFGPSSNDHSTLYIWDISIADDKQGRGFGAKTLDLVTEIALQRGLSFVELSVFDANSDARRLYERKGYVEITSHEGQALMRLDLGSPEKP
ncbi:MAG TPA: GNAT family N-acetyltransferase [Acidimicrobiia bacterium]